MKYRFVAKDSEGKTKTGFVESTDAKGATLLLQNNQLVVISLERADRSGELSKELSYLWEGVKMVELVMMFRQLTTLLEAKVPILVSFRVIEKQVTGNMYLRRILKEVGDDIEDGTPLYESLSRHPKIFTPLMVSMIKSGEISGHLQQSFSYIAGNLEKNYALTTKIKSALTYPGFVLSAALIVGFLVITFILPNLSTIIRDMNAPVPWYTELLMGTGDFFQKYWWAIAGSAFAVIGFFYYYVKTPVGKREWDRAKLKLPVIGTLFQYMYISRFSDNFSTLLSGGIPIASALQIVASVVGNGEYEQVILSAADEVKKGGSITTAFRRRSDLFPMIVPQMLEIGEETGKTEDTLKSVTSFYDQEADNIARNMTSLIEPILIVVLGIGVAIMVVGILLPVYSISSQAMQ